MPVHNDVLLDTIPDHLLYCVYCNIKLVRSRRLRKREVETSPILATIDHIFSNMDIRRLVAEEHYKYRVPCCKKCNQQRAADEISTMNRWYKEHIDNDNHKFDIISLCTKGARFLLFEDNLIKKYTSPKSPPKKELIIFIGKKLHRTPESILNRYYRLKRKLCAARQNTLAELMYLVQ